MNKTPDQQYPEDYNPSIDKTFIEGNSPEQVFPDLKAGKKIKATQIGATNPYSGSNTVIGERSAESLLPSGNEPIPLGSGTIVGMIGRGGMARVYKIWNEKLEVFRAVKILIPGQTELKKRFDTEAKITAKLHHPNIVEIYNVGEWNELPYLEMEFIDGESLESFITKRGKLPDSVCSSIAIQIARALVYAHSQEFLIYGKNYHGVIHRDLKPANIMISIKGDVRLMDFGIARPTEASLHTQEGNIVGTMQYLSPEQLDGVDIDARTDIYSFGAILYEMLTGTKTFPQDTITNLMKRKVMNDYRKFSEFEFSVSAGLAKIAQKCLQLRKEDRYPDVEALLHDLESFHRSNASEPPGKILKLYITDPRSFVSVEKKFSFKIPPFVVIPLVALLVIAGLVVLFLRTGPNNIENDANKKIVSNQYEPRMTIDSQKTILSTTPKTETDSNLVKNKNQYLTNSVQTPTKNSQDNIQSGNNNSKNVKDDKLTKNDFKVKDSKQKELKAAELKAAELKAAELKAAEKKPVAELSEIDKLKQKYALDDLMSIGKMAMKSHAYTDAITAFENVPESNPENQLRMLLLFEADVETGRTKDALYIASSMSVIDAQYDFLCGRLYEKIDKHKEALDYYQNALTKPSIVRNRNDIRNDALYYTAVLWSNQYKANPTQDSRIQMLNAWNIVKRSYSNSPEHPRFKKANTELASTE